MLKYLRVAWVLSIILHHVWLALGTRFARIKYKKYINTSRIPSTHTHTFNTLNTHVRVGNGVHVKWLLQVISHTQHHFGPTIRPCRSLQFVDRVPSPCIFICSRGCLLVCVCVPRVCIIVRYRQHSINFSHGPRTNSSLSIKVFFLSLPPFLHFSFFFCSLLRSPINWVNITSVVSGIDDVTQTDTPACFLF